jgi:hypothetical protein
MVKDFVVVAGPPNLTTISGQMMTFQVVPEDPLGAVHHPLVAAHLMVGVVAHHPSVNDHRHSVTAHHLMVAVAAAHPLAAGTEASVVLASHVDNQGTEHQTAQTSRQCGQRTACLQHGVAPSGPDQFLQQAAGQLNRTPRKIRRSASLLI